jgi:RHS repeat-associated protein
MTQELNKLTGETKKYYYDSENRMIQFEHQASDISPVDIMATYKYDIFGRRLRKDVNGAVTNFFWENDTMTYELDASYQPIRKYLVGMGIDNYEGHLEYSEITDWPHIFDANYNPPWYSYMKDQVGTIYKLYSLKTRSVVDSRTYDSFGNLVIQTGTTKTPLGFQGKYFDQESGLNYFYHRYYNPGIGRFISEDPIGLEGGLNIFAFALNGPIELRDKYGLNSWSDEHEEWMKLFCRMWASRRVSKGGTGFEYGSWLFPKGGEEEGDWWDSPKKNECSPIKNPPPAPFLMGSVHTHPRGKDRNASPPADTDLAEKYHPGLPMYIISEYGISAYISQRKRGRFFEILK